MQQDHMMRNTSLRLTVPPSDTDARFLSEAACRALLARIATFATGGGTTGLGVQSRWTGNVRWVRNQISTSGDVRNTELVVRRAPGGAGGSVFINVLDDRLLRAAVQRSEFEARFRHEHQHADLDKPYAVPRLTPTLWFDATYQQASAERAALVQHLVQPTLAAGMLAAGYIEVSATGAAELSVNPSKSVSLPPDLYYPYTMAQCSITVRDPQDKGSGWAGVSWNDWSRIDAAHLCDVALDKCLRSRNPVAIEPGRYTTILEPQAVFDLTRIIFQDYMSRQWAEQSGRYKEATLGYSAATVYASPFATGEHAARFGERVIDERLTVTMDPMDPDLGFPPLAYQPVTWIQDGILKELSYSREYAVKALGLDMGGYPNRGAYKMTGRGTPTSIEEMIATTKRGLLVTRFWGIGEVLDVTSILLNGYTRDGLWLIENGKISKPVWNFRFTESPLFVLNNVEQVGVPQRVFNPEPERPAVVPALKVRDFSFTALSDAV
jgi:predicted Zn-dependent protease